MQELDNREAAPSEKNIMEDHLYDPSVPLVLSPRRAYPKSESLDNFFICKVCLKVVSQPKECNKCQTLFCGLCIDLYVKSIPVPLGHRKVAKANLTCPLRC